MAGHDHTYRTSLTWSGSTGDGYERYERVHEVGAAPALTRLSLSADPAFRGDASRLNPEQLLVASASSCQLLSFLAVSARARLDVVSYTDNADAVMVADDLPLRITRIDLRPAIALADTDRARPSEERLRHLCELAHRECYVASSLRTDVVVKPTFTWVS